MFDTLISSGNTFEQLATDSSVEGRVAVASHPACPVRVQIGLATDDSELVQLALVERNDCSPFVLTAVCCKPGTVTERVRLAVARHPNCTPGPLAILCLDESKFVRLAVAQHHNITSSVALALATDCDSEVQLALVNNQNCHSVEAFYTLQRSNEEAVRVAIARRLARIFDQP